MGDRANFGFKQSNGQTVVLYGHWAGHQMLANLAYALEKARPRWTDEGYATRIAISNMVGPEWESETGWGIYVNAIPDNEHKIPVVDWKTQTVSLVEELDGEPIFTMDLDSFCTKYAMSLV